jgi:hypothetical protein
MAINIFIVERVGLLSLLLEKGIQALDLGILNNGILPLITAFRSDYLENDRLWMGCCHPLTAS